MNRNPRYKDFESLISETNVTRVRVVGDEVHEFWADEWWFNLQDDGRTLRLYQIGDGVDARRERDEALARDISAAIKAKRATDGADK